MTRHITRMEIDDAEHYSPEQRAAIISSYPAHELEARTKGIPSLGSGRVFPISEDRIVIDPIPLARDWSRINGIDFGYDHPFGAVGLVWNKDADVIYVVSTYREREKTPVIHAAAVKPWGDWIPCAWPHDGFQHDKGSGDELAAQYRTQGLNMLHEHATHEDGGFGIEGGITEMHDRMMTGRFKVFRHLAEWLAEFRLYHREKSLIVKERDDLMAATRYGVMMRRFAEIEPRARNLPRGSGTVGGWMG